MSTLPPHLDVQAPSTGAPWLPAGPAMLFAPADRPDRFAKAADRADVVIVDLEDGAGQDNHAESVDNMVNCGLDPASTVVRVSAPDSPFFADDIAAVTRTNFETIIVPKVTEPLPNVAAQFQVIAMVETPTALINLGEIARQDCVVGLLWGAEDFTAYLGGTHSRLQGDEPGWSGEGSVEGPYRPVIHYLRSQTLIHAAAAGIVAIDAVHADITDEAGLRHEALDAARSGFAATACIHPAQVPIVRDAFSPSEEQIRYAMKVMEAARQKSGALNIDGKMVDAPLISQARRVLARAGISYLPLTSVIPVEMDSAGH